MPRISSLSSLQLPLAPGKTRKVPAGYFADVVTNANMSSFYPANSVTHQIRGYQNRPFLRLDTLGNLNNTYWEFPISPKTWDPNNWVLEAVFRPRLASPATGWTVGTSLVSYGVGSSGNRIGLEYFSTSLQMFESNGSTGGGGAEYSISTSLNNWIYFKTWEDVNFAGSGLLLYDLTTGTDIARVTGTPNYFYYSSTPTVVTIGGNPAYTNIRKMDVDIAFVRLRRNAAANKGFPTMPFNMPTEADISPDDVFFMVGV